MAGAGVTVQAESLLFVENGAGTYIGKVTLPAGCTLLDIVISAEALWAAGTSAALIVGDGTDDDGYWASINLKATDATAAQSFSMASTQVRGGKPGAYQTDDTSTDVLNRTVLGQDVIAKVVSVGAGATGRTRVVVVYAVAQDRIITQ